MSRLGHALIAPLLLALSLGALASGVDTYEFRHPERQTRAQELARSLRCPQCQNQNLVESNSPIARDLRLEVYRWVDEGQSDEQVIARMTAQPDWIQEPIDSSHDRKRFDCGTGRR